MKKLLILASFLMIFGFAAAKPQTSHVVLSTDPSSGEIGPGQKLSIKLDPLVRWVMYTVTCHILDPNNQNNQVSVLFARNGGAGLGDISLNGTVIGGGYGQGTLPAVDTWLRMTYVAELDNYANGVITITNKDQKDEIKVFACQAVADSSWHPPS